MKKKTWKPLLITAAVLVACGALALLLTLLPDSGGAEASATPTSSASADETTIYLINENYYTLDTIDVRFRDNPDGNLTISAYTEDEQRQFSVSPSVAGWTYNRDTLSSTAWNAVSITALAKVSDDPDDLAYYGLDDPQYTFKISFEDGKEYTLSIGGLTALEDSYYGMINDDPAVYAVAKYSVQKLAAAELSYRELNFFDTSVYLDEEAGTYDANGDITYVRVYNKNLGVDLEFRQRTAAELAGDLPAGSTTWRMLRPIESECNDTNVEDSLVDAIVPLSITSVVTDVAGEETLAEYGFDDPIEIWLERADGDSVHYYIGSYNSSGDCYVMVEGCNSVLYATGFVPSVLQTKYLDMMFKLLWIKNISDVTRIEYDLGGTKRLLSIIENYKDDGGNDVFYATLDGREITATNAKRLFTYALNLMIMGDLDEPLDVEGKTPDYSIAISLKNGERHTLELYALNERQFAASINGENADFYVNVSDIKALKTAFEYQDRGDEVPRAS